MARSVVLRHWTRFVVTSICVGLASLAAATACGAQAPSLPVKFTNVRLRAFGGNTTALLACVTAPKTSTEVRQVDLCQNPPIAADGSISLQGVQVLVWPSDATTGGPTRAPQGFRNVDVIAKGGDATALVNCLNQAKAGTITQGNICNCLNQAKPGTITQGNMCAPPTVPTVPERSVDLTDVDVTISKHV